jgi:hypothetical protein
MSKIKISEYFNPHQHLVFHQDKDGNMLGGGYQLNNLMHHNKCPLFVSLDDKMTGGGHIGGGGGGGRSDEMENQHFIPEKFSDLFRDLAVPAGLFMMPAMFKPRNYAFEVAERDAGADADAQDNGNNSDDDSDDDSDPHTKSVPNDIFDTLLALVAPSERIQHDVKTRRHRERTGEPEKKHNNKKNTTRRTRNMK